MLEEIQSPSLKGMIDTVSMQLAGETPDGVLFLPSRIKPFSPNRMRDGQSDTHLVIG